MTVPLLIAVAAITLASLAGVIVIWTGFGHWVEENLGMLTSFAAGIFLVVSFQLVLNTVEISSSIWAAGGYILLGVIFILGVFRFVPLFHHHHHPKESEHTHKSLDVRRILFADALHNIGDGLLLFISFSVSTTTGIMAAVGIFFHELVQEISEFFVLKQGGFSTKKALLMNFAVSTTIIVGIVLGLIGAEMSETITPILLGITAGSFLVVVGHDLIPHSVRESKKNNEYIEHIIWFLLGVLLMIGVMLVMGETHAH